MSSKNAQSSKKQASGSSSDQKKLNCGGQPCSTCGACRDWYFHSDNSATLKRKDGKCIHDNIFGHGLIRDPKDESSYPVGRFVCECKDNQ